MRPARGVCGEWLCERVGHLVGNTKRRLSQGLRVPTLRPESALPHRVEVAGIRGQGLALCDQGRLLVGPRVDQDLNEEEGIARNTKESDFSPEIRMATPACVTCKASLLGYNGRARLGGILWKRTEKKAAVVSGLWDTVPSERIVSPRLSRDCRIAFCLALVRFTLVVSRTRGEG